MIDQLLRAQTDYRKMVRRDFNRWMKEQTNYTKEHVAQSMNRLECVNYEVNQRLYRLIEADIYHS